MGLILLLLTCLHAGPLLLNCAAIGDLEMNEGVGLTKSQALLKRKAFLSNLSDAEFADQSSWWALDQLDLDQEYRDNLLSKMTRVDIEMGFDHACDIADSAYMILGEY
ncbi:MAG: hypothetical protein OXC30_00335 [Alphaproteobacteria bacterium]|nr:hypothetical protein [Alphaproteobacteria bacterium]